MRIEQPSPYQQLRISVIEEPVKDFRLFTLLPVDGGNISYSAGQYITLKEHGGIEEVRRSYSMVSAPLLREPMTIGVKRLENGAFSRLLFRLKPGNILTATGTGGLFTLPATVHTGQRFVFLAAGAGITPIFPLIKTLLALYPGNSVLLLYSNSSSGQTVFLRELMVLEKDHPDFKIEFFFSDDKDLRRARLNSELLFHLLDRYGVGRDTLFYLCGPEAYMRMCLFSLREAGVLDEQIKKENFVIRKKDPAYNKPPDEGPHEVIIDISGRMIPLRVQYPLSILETAKRSGVALPYSCEAGICGNCVARCIAGAVWMSNNEVLTPADLKEKLVLTCTGFPVFGDVVLKI